ncbi:MAG: choice-of-anchor Q domain-containing protein [Planctomycetaceae bacterium]
MLTVFMVTNVGDSGSGSLRQAVSDAEGNAGADEIAFDSGLTGQILLTSGALTITEDLTISGNGRDSTVINATFSSRHFSIFGPGTDVVISGLTLRNGRTTGSSQHGGAIEFTGGVDSTLTIRDSALVNNATTDSFSFGGAIDSAAKSNRLTIVDSELTGNFTSGGASFGGAIFTQGAVSITDSVFTNNYTTNGFSSGGVIFGQQVEAEITILGSTFTGNHVDASDSRGGVIAHLSSAAISITNSTLANNTAGGNGGAIDVQGADVHMQGSTLSGNRGDLGGGIHLSDNANLVAINSTFSGNIAELGGGGIMGDDNITLLNCTVTQNGIQSGGGGGINLANSNNVVIQNSIIQGNLGTGGIDLDATGFSGTLDLKFSLIGNNTNSSLTPSATPDANGNIIGTSSAPASAFLTALANLGGPTAVHAIGVSNSPALNAGSNSLAFGLATDQRGLPFSRIRGGRVDMGAYEAPLPRVVGGRALFTGTELNEVFSLDFVQVFNQLEGFTYFLTGSVLSVEIDGGGGLDILALTTPGTADRVILNANTGIHRVDIGRDGTFDISARNLEGLLIDGGAGDDAIVVNDSSGNDRLTASTTFGQLSGSGFEYAFSNFESVDVRSNFSFDTDIAELFDSAGADRFIASPTGASLLTSGFALSTTGFSQVTAAGSNGVDRAIFRDAAGVDDNLIGSPLRTQRIGAGFNNIAVGFDSVTAQSTSGHDFARLTGDANADALTARPGIATFSTGGVNLFLEGFQRLEVDAREGTDFLRLYGSNGDDTFIARPDSAQMIAAGFDVRGYSFETMIGVALGGNDTALMFDSVGGDSFQGFGSTAQLRGPGNIFTQRALGFDLVSIFGTAGGVNSRSLSPPLGYLLNSVGSWV